MNRLIFPMKVMTITQNYNGTTSHKPHTTGKPCDFPIDIAGADTGKDAFYCPCDEVVIKKIYGVGAKGTNTIWIESTSKVDLADGSNDYVTMQITHPDDADISSLKVGQKFKRGEVICHEGKDGATGNHIHLSVAKGKMKSTGWEKNTNDKWVLTATGEAIKPEKAFFVDESFTSYKNKGNLKWTKLTEATEQKAESKTETKPKTKNYEVICDILRVRIEPTTNKRYKQFNELTSDAQKKIKGLRNGQKICGYVKGMKFTALEEKVIGTEKWAKSPSGWLCISKGKDTYCKEI